ncbi:MAG TPA: TonB-dependent receptor [Vicinamibacterales bacterium]|nr:TonB-dependent receptor [Vicinamibacterales bacterium]
MSRFHRVRRSCLLLALALAIAASRSAFAQPRVQAPAATGAIEGIVSTQRGTIPLGAATIIARDASGIERANILSDGDGRFAIANLPPGKYDVMVSLDGFVTFAARAVVAAGVAATLNVDLPIANLTDSVTVVAPTPIVSSAETIAASAAIDNKETDRLAPGSGLQGALRLLASVIEVPSGLSIRGGRPAQSGTQIGSTTLADPSTGLVRFTLPDDAIDSVSVLPNPYAVEYGRFSSGVVVIQTRRAGDKWKARINNLDPWFRSKRHEDYVITGIAGFAPRFAVGGPIVQDRLFVEETAQYRYSAEDVASRPEDELKTTHWFSSFTRVDANLTPRHSLSITGGWFPSVANLASLGTFTPPDATVDVHERVNRLAVTERALWNDHLVGETSVLSYNDQTTLLPQGTRPMQLLPDTTLGNFFNAQQRTPSAVQVVETLSGSINAGATGLHLYKFGLDVLRTRFDASSDSRPVDVRRADGTLTRSFAFTGTGFASVRSTDVALFAQDRMQPSPRWYVEYGARVDRDGVPGRWNATPRVGAAWLFNDEGTSVLRGGYGLFFERTPSAAGAFGAFDVETDTRFASDGVTPLGPPIVWRHVTTSSFETPRSATWDAAYDYRINPRWKLQASIMARHGTHELIVSPILAQASGEWLLDSAGESRYRVMEFGVHYARSPRADLQASYSYSKAESNLNAFMNFFDMMLSPVVRPDAYVHSATDVPHRVLVRGHLMPRQDWLIVGVADWHTGTPYSVVDSALDFAGTPNAQRLPDYFRLDAGLEHRFRIAKWRPWIGMRAYNILDSFNPMDVQANLGSPNFGSFYNSPYRQLRLQVRFER